MNESALKDNTVHINSRTLQLLREGDERAFEQIFNFYYNRIYSFALNTLFDKTFAEDITQTVFITLWEKRETIEPEIDIAPLLYTIAKNRVYRQTQQMLRKYKYEQTQQDIVSELSDPEETVNYHFMENILSELIEKIPSARRRIFLLSRKDNLSNREIANRLQISEKTVETQIRRAIAFLKDHMRKFLVLLIV